MGRQCWIPTSAQLNILQCTFDGSNKTPNNAEIVQIVFRLSSHTHISEKNVQDWFSNRRAQSKRKHVCTQAKNLQLKNLRHEMQLDRRSWSFRLTGLSLLLHWAQFTIMHTVFLYYPFDLILFFNLFSLLFLQSMRFLQALALVST